jgi:predicted Fe-Mo cluster-binding NifX family protein
MDLNSQIDPRFGRCAFFIIVETDDMSSEAYPNENINLSSGAGNQSGSFVASKGVKAVLTGNCGPKALQTLVAADIDVSTGHTGTVREAVERFKKGESASTEVNISHNNIVPEADMVMGGRGMRGTGRGMGMGGGKGMCGSGRGMQMGFGIQKPISKDMDSHSKAEALKDLKERAEELQRQMDDIAQKIRSLE